MFPSIKLFWKSDVTSKHSATSGGLRYLIMLRILSWLCVTHWYTFTHSADQVYLLQEVPGQLPNISCLTQNYTELVVPDGQLFTGQHLSIFRCYMLNMSEPTSELSQRLKQTVQKLCSLELHVTKKLIDQDCILTPSQQDVNFNVKCVLKLLDQHLSRATFS